MKLLLAPLARLGNLFEAQNEKMSEMHDAITVDLVKAAKTTVSELAQQTVLLTEIRDLIKDQIKQGDKDRKEQKKGGKFKLQMPTLFKAAEIGLTVVAMAAAIVIAGAFFMLMPVLNPFALLSALAVAAIFVLVAPTFIQVAKMIKKVKEKDLLFTALAMPAIAVGILLASLPLMLMPVLNPWAMLGAVLIAATFYLIAPSYVKIAKVISKMNPAQIAMAAAALPIIAIGIVLTAVIFLAFNAIPNPVAPPWQWTLEAGLALFVFAGSFALIANSIRKLKPNKMMFAAMAIPLIAVSIVLTAFIFSFASALSAWEAPPWEWTGKAGLALAVFSIPFVLVAMAAKSLTYGAMIKAMVAAPLIAISILAVAWIFQLLPSTFLAPPTDWSLGAGLAIAIFAIPFAIVGMIATAITPAGLLFGALGVILIAGVIFVVAWIFSGLPDLSSISANFTDAMMYPVNAMIDALGRFKNEIGVENMLGLAGGIIAIAGAWLILTAALVGQSGGGLVSSILDGVSGAVSSFTNWIGWTDEEDQMSPIDLLDRLINRTSGIKGLADPLNDIANAYNAITRNQDAVVAGLNSVLSNVHTFFGISNLGESTAQFADAFGKIAEHSNNINIRAVDATTRMFNAIARVAEAQGEDAISALARELMVAVKELSETVDNMEQVMESQQKNMKDVISGALSTFKDKIFGAKEEAGGSDKAVDMSDVVAAIEALEDRFNRAIPVKSTGGF